MAEANTIPANTKIPALTADDTHTTMSQSQLQLSPGEISMFNKVVTSGHTIKNQQRGEPDLTNEQEIGILSSLLDKNPGAFLMRFGTLLDKTDLAYFEEMQESNFEVKFRLKELLKSLDASSEKRKKQVRNRRFGCLQELMDNSSYFSQEEMRDRNPLLFEQYIGQYLTEEERDQLDSNRSEMKLSSIILKNLDIDRRRQLLHSQQKSEMEFVEESDSDESTEEENTDSKTPGLKLSTDPSMATEEKHMMRKEFLRVMQLNFLSGNDKDFDYTSVDSNERYDLLEERQRDDEDAYFDSEEPDWCEGDDRSNDDVMEYEDEPPTLKR